MRHAAALDVGGTKLAAAVVAEDGAIVRQARAAAIEWAGMRGYEG